MPWPCRTNGAKWKETLRGPGWAGQGTRAGGGNNGMSVDRSLGLGNPRCCRVQRQTPQSTSLPSPHRSPVQPHSLGNFRQNVGKAKQSSAALEASSNPAWHAFPVGIIVVFSAYKGRNYDVLSIILHHLHDHNHPFCLLINIHNI